MSVGLVGCDPLREQLQRVIESETFRHSESLRRLLAYLAEHSLNNTADQLKEYVIGTEVFSKPTSYDPQKDASVRVQMSRLRQKIEEYYNGPGRGDPYRLELPKGHFTIAFRPRPEEAAPAEASVPAPPATRVTPARIAFILALVLIAASAVSITVLWRRVDILKARLAPAVDAKEFEPVWAGFLNPEVPSIVVFGSPPFFASTSRPVFMRMYRLANPDDPRSSAAFNELEAKLGPLEGPRFDYVSMGDAIGVQRLTSFFGLRGIPLRALPAHLAAWDTIQDANVIFLGAARMNPLLRRLPVRQDFEIGPDENIHNRNPQPGEQAVYETTSHRDSMTYAVVGSHAGLKPQREILLLAAHSTAGAVGAVDFITSIEGVRVIRDHLRPRPGERKHFQVLLRVFTDNDSPVKTEYVTHHVAQ